MKKTELQALLKAHDLKGASKTKPELVQILTGHWNSMHGVDDDAASTESPANELGDIAQDGIIEDSPVEAEEQSEVQTQAPRSRGRAKPKKTAVAADPATAGESDAQQPMDMDGSTQQNENDGTTTTNSESQPSAKPEPARQEEDQPKAALAKRKSIYGLEIPVSKFLARHKLPPHLEATFKREELLDWKLLRLMTVADFKAIGVPAGTALRFILAVKEEFPETVTSDDASSINISIPVDHVKSLMDELEGKLGTMSLTDEATKGKLPTSRAQANLSKPRSRGLSISQATNPLAERTTLDKPAHKLRTVRSMASLVPKEDATSVSPTTPGRPPVAPIAKKPIERKPRAAPSAAGANGAGGPTENKAEGVKKNGHELTKKKSVANLGVAFGSSTPAPPARKTTIRKPPSKAKLAKGANQPEPLVRADSPSSEADDA
ncbi:hypothetical protein HDV00_005982 [Rhizophlyctis rosea]|nr:hypothetical protein HDV00_005982 [Rhizophlyctis rosea]